MPESVGVVRAAFREIQKLPNKYFEYVAEIIRNMGIGDRGDCRRLVGYRDLWRTKKGRVRVIWTRNGSNSILIIRAGLRKEVYRGVLEDRNRINPLSISDVLNIPEDRISDIPTYEWDQTNRNSWYQFVYGGYLYSPILTNEQRELFNQIQQQSSQFLHRDKILSFLLQSSPGTGKTVFAALAACELHKSYGWNVALILPETLCEKVKEVTNVKRILQQEHDNFFVGSFAEWIDSLAPDVYSQMASQDEELKALESSAQRNHTISRNEQLTVQDLMIYRSFVIDRNEPKHHYHPIYIDNQKRIDKLSKIREERWREILRNQGKISWLDGLEELTNESSLPKQNKSDTSIIIFDEAQDYLLRELGYIINMLNRWQNDGHSVILGLLGDMNQRIQAVDFNWDSLRLGTTYNLKYNYRNTRRILEFANTFHGFAQRRGDIRGRHLPEPCNPIDTFEIGEPVRILEVSLDSEAFLFLENLSEKIRESNDLSERSLLRKLSGRVTFIHTGTLEDRTLDGIEYLSVEQAKGREFDACIAFCIFNGEGSPTFQEANKWYTIFTRPRRRLLVVATTSQIDRIGREYFETCDSFSSGDTETLINWIREWSNSEYLFRDNNAICNLLYDGINSQPIQLYWDTYPALRLAGCNDYQIGEIEIKLIEKLKNQSIELLFNELSQMDQIHDDVDRVPLKCLILRSMSRSWEAADEASKIKNGNTQEQYNRLINAIASDLENQGLVYEAARLKTRIGIPFPPDYPFSESLVKNPTWLNKPNLVSLLNRLFTNKTITKLSDKKRN